VGVVDGLFGVLLLGSADALPLLDPEPNGGHHDPVDGLPPTIDLLLSADSHG